MAITIATLRAAGLSAEEMVRVLEAEETERTNKQREQWRIRSRNYRERHANHGDARDESDDSDARDAKEKEEEKKEKYQKKEKKKKEKNIYTELPLFWLPNENGLALAKRQGWDDHRIKLEIHRFQDSAQQHNRRYADWQAAWRNWVTSPYQNGAPNGHAKKPTLVELGEQLADEARAIERRAGIGRQDDPFGID